MAEFPHPASPIHWPILVKEEWIWPIQQGLHRTALLSPRPFQAESIRRWGVVTIARRTKERGIYDLVGYYHLTTISPFEFPSPAMTRWDKDDVLGLNRLAQNVGFDSYEDLYHHHASKVRAGEWEKGGYHIVEWGERMDEDEAVRRMRADPFNIVGFPGWNAYYGGEDDLN